MTDGPHAGSEPEKQHSIDRVLQDSSLYLLGNVASRIVGFFAIPFYARFLSPAQYGLIELVELSTQTIAIALGLQAIGAALSRVFHDQKTWQDEQAVISTSLIATAVLSAAVTILAVIFAGHLSELVFHTDEWTGLLRAAFVAMFFSNMMEVVLVYERIRNNARFFLYYTLISLSLTLGLNILFIGVLQAGVWGFVSSKLVVSVGGSAFLMLRMRRDVGWHWRRAYVPDLVRIGAPLILSSLSYFAIHFSDRFFLASAVSLAELGRYALAYKLAILVSALVGDSFDKSWNATLYRYTSQEGWRAQFARIASYFTYVLFTTGLAIAVFSPELLRIMVPKEYFPPPLLLPIIVSSYLAREIGDFFRSLLLINKRAGLVGQIALGSALLNGVANVLLIPRYGIYGAAVATFVTWFVYMLACWTVANREHRLPVEPRAYIRIGLLVTTVYLVAWASRLHALVPQILMDGFWVVVFAVAAAGWFLSTAERRGALVLAGSLVLAFIVRGATPKGQAPAKAAAPSAGQAEDQAGERAGKSPLHVLILAYHFPPRNEIGAARPGRFTRWLRRAGVPTTVVTSGESFGQVDDEMVLHVPPEPESRPPVRFDIRPTLGVRWSASLLFAAERVFLPYDDRLAWFPHAFQASIALITPDTVLLSTHPPTVTHLTALALKHRTGVRWVADFRDPLWGNPYRTSHRAAMIDPIVERLTVENADAVVANTEAAAQMLRGRYPEYATKIHVIWNGFDPDDPVRPCPPPSRRRRVLAHVGTLYGNRTLLPVLLSLERLIERGQLDPETIEIQQVGRADPSCLNLADPALIRMAERGCLHVVDRHLPRHEARDCMATADWLLLLDMNLVNPGLQVPAKTYEYVRTSRPILAVTSAGSSTERVLELSGIEHDCIDMHAAPAQFDAALLAFLRRPIVASAPSEAFWTEFAAPRQVQHLLEIMNAIETTKAAVAENETAGNPESHVVPEATA